MTKPSKLDDDQTAVAQDHIASVLAPPNKEAISVSNALSASVELLDVVLVETRARLFTGGISEEKLRAVVEPVQFRGEFRADAGLLLCGVRFEVAVVGATDVKAMELFAEYALSYRVPATVEVTDNGTRLFAGRNAVFNAWPFLRELAHSTAARMNVKAVALPLFRLPMMPPK